MNVQGHHPTPHTPSSPHPGHHTPTGHKQTPHHPTHHKPTAHKPTAHKPAAHRPNHSPAKGKHTAARNEVGLVWADVVYAPLAKSGHIH